MSHNKHTARKRTLTKKGALFAEEHAAKKTKSTQSAVSPNSNSRSPASSLTGDDVSISHEADVVDDSDEVVDLGDGEVDNDDDIEVAPLRLQLLFLPRIRALMKTTTISTESVDSSSSMTRVVDGRPSLISTSRTQQSMSRRTRTRSPGRV